MQIVHVILIQHLYSATSKLVLRGPQIGPNVQDVSTGGMEEGVVGVW